MLKYFTKGELSRDEFVENPLALGFVCGYLADAVLDGFINYVKIVKAVVIDDRNPLVDNDRPSLNEVDVRIDSKWTKIEPKSKQEAHAILFKDGCSGVTHPQINQLQDRVLILAKAGDSTYWYFEYGFTGADCAIGRFKTDDPQMYVEEIFMDFAFSEHTKSLQENNYPSSHPVQVPASFFNRGWISW